MPTKAPVKFGSPERWLRRRGCSRRTAAAASASRSPRLRRDTRSGAARNQSRRADARAAGGDGDRRREGVGLRRVGQAGHHPQMFAERFHHARGGGNETSRCCSNRPGPRSAENAPARTRPRVAALKQCACCRRATSDCLNRLPIVSRPKSRRKPGPRGEAENLLRPRRAQPLEIDGQLRAVEIFARRRRREWVNRQRRRGRFDGRKTLPIQGAQPAVPAPNHFLNRRFAAERAAAAIAQRPAAEINHVSLAVLRFDQVGVAGALQFDVRAGAASSGCKCPDAVRKARSSFRDRAIVTACPQPVPPSAVSR